MFGEGVMLVDQVTVPLQVLLPAEMVQVAPETAPEGVGGGAAQVLPFQLVPPTQLALSMVVLRTVLLSLTETEFDPYTRVATTLVPEGLVEYWLLVVVLIIFGDEALLVDQVTVPLQVLLPADMVQPAPETEPDGGGSAQVLPFQEVPPTQLAVKSVDANTVELFRTTTLFEPY